MSSPPSQEDETVRRNGLMQNIADGLPKCVNNEHCDMYRTIRTMQPTAPFTTNHNGVFLSLLNLRTDVLECCHEVVQHGLAQERKERKRAEAEHRLHSELTAPALPAPRTKRKHW